MLSERKEKLELTGLEAAVLHKMLLTGEHPALVELHQQLLQATVKSREYSGVGFFTDFEWSNGAVPIAGLGTTHFSDVHGELEGLEHGAGFILFVDDGIATMLEGHTYSGAWPKEEKLLSLRYEPTRDYAQLDKEHALASLCKMS